VLQHWRELYSSIEYPWDRLCDSLQGSGVQDIDHALLMLRFKPIHEALRELVHPDVLEALIEAAEKDAQKPAEKKFVKPVDVQGVKQSPNAWLTLASERAGNFFEEIGRIAGSSVPLDVSEKQFHEACRDAIRAVERLPGLEAALLHGWPAEARIVLPSCSPATSSMKLWAPVLAWSVLNCLAPQKSQALELFDRLQFRIALAEIFSSLGLEGEDAWRASARVRILLAFDSLERPELGKVFWDDPDVQWLAGVNESEGTTYFNQESFEQLLWWMRLPNLVAAMCDDIAWRVAVIDIESQLRTLFAAAKQAGYAVNAFAALLRQTNEERVVEENVTVHEEDKFIGAPTATSIKGEDLNKKST